MATSSGQDARVLDLVRDESFRVVFNFEVRGSHNYFVGNNEDAPALLAHNQCAGDKLFDAVNALETAARSDQVSPFLSAIDTVKGTLDEASSIATRIEAAGATAAADLAELKGIVQGADNSVKALTKLADAIEATQPGRAKVLRHQAEQLKLLAGETEGALSRLALSKLRFPNDRHFPNSMSEARSAGNSLVTIGKEAIRIDVAEIQAGKALKSGDTFVTTSGRVYGTHHGILYPMRGPGIVELSSPEYKALRAIMKDAEKGLSELAIKEAKGQIARSSVDRVLDLSAKLKPKR